MCALCDDLDVELFKMFNGGVEHPLRIGSIPHRVRCRMGWHAGGVYITPRTAQKIRWHDGREASFNPVQALLAAINHGEIVRETDREKSTRDIVFMLQMESFKKHVYVPCRLNECQSGLFVRTAHPRLITNGKRRRLQSALDTYDEIKRAA